MYSILVTESTLCPSLFVYYSIPKDLCFTYVTYFSISPYISEQMNRLWVCYEHLGVWCILISCDWILHLLPLLSGRWGNCPKLCKKFDAALIWQVAITKQLKILNILSKEGQPHCILVKNLPLPISEEPWWMQVDYRLLRSIT